MAARDAARANFSPDWSEPCHGFGSLEPGEERPVCGEGAVLILFDSVYWQLLGVFDVQADTRMASMFEGLDLYADLRDGGF